MKLSPIAATDTPAQNIGSIEVSGASTGKLERARSIARGESPQVTQAPQPEKKEQDVRKIKMRTNQTPQQPEPIQEALSSIPDSSEAEATVEATQPLSPQFAALARQKRALQLEKAEFDKQKAELSSQPTKALEEYKAKLKSSPMRTMLEEGVSYDQLTEEILSDQGGFNPEIQELKAQIKALKEGVDKTLVDRDTQAEQAALNEMRREADRLAKEGDTFEMVRETQSLPKVIDLIHRTYKQTGEILDVTEAMQLVEDELVNDSLKLASYKKIQSKLAPQPIPQPQQRPNQMRTLTARDTAAPTMDRKARALAAFTGTLRK